MPNTAIQAKSPLSTSTSATVSSSPVLMPSTSTYVGIFLVAAAVLLFELSLTRVFAVMLWAHLAFMVVGTALFGFGLSGAYLAMRRSKPTADIGSRLSRLCLYLAVSIVACYVVILHVPFRMWNFAEDPTNFLYLAVWYAALVVPFFVAGIIVAEILSTYKERSSKLYGVDLIGAAIGSLLLVPLIPKFAAEGVVVCAAFIAAVAAYTFAPKNRRKRRWAVLAIIALAVLAPKASEVLPIKLHQTKRRFNQAVQANHIYDTRWSAISRVDIGYHNDNIFDIWIDGGTNESAILRWTGDMNTLKPMKWSTIGTVYDLKRGTEPRTMIIGPSGGKEVLFALSHGASHVDAVELDPSIVALVGEEKYAKFMGRLYQNPKVNLVNDEGRSFLRRMPKEHYDIIQSVNNYTPVAMSSGALNLSAAFLLTKESINDYLDHLTEDGVLALHRGAALRMSVMVMEVLAERGIEDPAKHIVISSGEVPFFDGFYLKKSPWTKQEVDKIGKYLAYRKLEGNKKFLWNPFAPEEGSIYSEILQTPTSELSKFYNSLGVKLSPPTDDRPFIEHFLQFGQKELSEKLPQEFNFRNEQKWRGIIPRGDFPYVAILLESALLALLFIAVPLIRGSKKSDSHPFINPLLLYFSCLGFGFIMIEISLMKRYVLFLGNPVYSITTVLVAILCAAGLGSIYSTSLKSIPARRRFTMVIGLLIAVVLLETLVSPIVFDTFLNLEFAWRVVVASIMLFPLGFMLGMPFPLGLAMINSTTKDEAQRRQGIAWAWGANGYWTVIGSAATVFIAVFLGFKAALLIAVIAYAIAYMAISRIIAQQ